VKEGMSRSAAVERALKILLGSKREDGGKLPCAEPIITGVTQDMKVSKEEPLARWHPPVQIRPTKTT